MPVNNLVCILHSIASHFDVKLISHSALESFPLENLHLYASCLLELDLYFEKLMTAELTWSPPVKLILPRSSFALNNFSFRWRPFVLTQSSLTLKNPLLASCTQKLALSPKNYFGSWKHMYFSSLHVYCCKGKLFLIQSKRKIKKRKKQKT